MQLLIDGKFDALSPADGDIAGEIADNVIDKLIARGLIGQTDLLAAEEHDKYITETRQKTAPEHRKFTPRGSAERK